MAGFRQLFLLALLAVVAASASTRMKVAAIKKKSHNRNRLDKNITQLVDDIQEAEKTIADANGKRAKMRKEYEADSADLQSAIDSLDGSISTATGSESLSRIQLQLVSQTFRKALVMADEFGFDDVSSKKAVVALLQQTEAEMALQDFDFDYPGSRLVYLLGNLQKNFREEKADVVDAEVESIAQHGMLVQEQMDIMKGKNQELAGVKEMKEKEIMDVASHCEKLTTVVPTLLEDQICVNQHEL